MWVWRVNGEPLPLFPLTPPLFLVKSTKGKSIKHTDIDEGEAEEEQEGEHHPPQPPTHKEYPPTNIDCHHTVVDNQHKTRRENTPHKPSVSHAKGQSESPRVKHPPHPTQTPTLTNAQVLLEESIMGIKSIKMWRM